MKRLAPEHRVEDCRPALLDPNTKKPFPDDSDEMRKIMALWNSAPASIRDAWHRFSCLNERDAKTTALVALFSQAVETAFAAGRNPA